MKLIEFRNRITALEDRTVLRIENKVFPVYAFKGETEEIVQEKIKKQYGVNELLESCIFFHLNSKYNMEY